jgi:ubiquitin-conjugating enzyme E2 J2
MRLQRDYASIQKSPIPFIQAHPSSEDILQWSFVISGPPNTPYHTGQYYGNVKFPPTFPYAAPGISLQTPSERFQTGMDICTSFSYHHAESWNPAWTVESLLTGFLSFMTSSEHTYGSVVGTIDENKIKAKARESRKFNSLELPGFRQEFPELHAANLEDVSFTDSDRRRIWTFLELEDKAEEEEKRVNSAKTASASMTFDEHINEDWEKYGSMEDDFLDDDFNYEDDDEDDEEMEEVDEEYESEDTERDSSEMEK